MRALLLIGLGAALTLFFSASAAMPTETLSREPAFYDNFYGVKIRGPRAWIVGYYGTILYSEDRGASWQIQSSGTANALYRIVFSSEKEGWISGSYGTLLHTKDGGKSWTPTSTRSLEHLFGLNFINERIGWIVGSRGTVLQTTDGGSSWVNRSISQDIILSGISFSNSQLGWMVGEFGVIFRTNDGGKLWTKQASPVEVSFFSGESRNLFAVLFSGSGTGWAFGLDGVILKTLNGDDWKIAHKNGATPHVTEHHLFAGAAHGKNLWAVGERGTLLVSEAGRENWKKARLDIPPLSLNAIDFSQDGFGLIVGNRGLILHTRDGGRQWGRITIVPRGPGQGIAQRHETAR